MSLIERTDETDVGDDGYRRIRSDIIFGRLRPGQKLRLEGLKETYGVSVSTLREILNRLAAEGFVVAEGQARLRGRARLNRQSEGARRAAAAAGMRTRWRTHSRNADVEWEGRVVSAHHKLASTERLMESEHRRARAMEAL